MCVCLCVKRSTESNYTELSQKCFPLSEHLKYYLSVSCWESLPRPVVPRPSHWFTPWPVSCSDLWVKVTLGWLYFVLSDPTDDHTRVRLQLLEGDPHSDYINANYIDVSIHTIDGFGRSKSRTRTVLVLRGQLSKESKWAPGAAALFSEGCTILVRLFTGSDQCEDETWADQKLPGRKRRGGDQRWLLDVVMEEMEMVGGWRMIHCGDPEGNSLKIIWFIFIFLLFKSVVNKFIQTFSIDLTSQA